MLLVPPATASQFFITESGRIGVGEVGITVGDVVGVLLGGQMPFILRQEEKGDHMLVGQAYVHGIMDGEVTREGGDPEWINLE